MNNEVRLNRIAIMDGRHLWVYCRSCRRSAFFWDLIKHTKRCAFAADFRALLESNSTLWDCDPGVAIPCAADERRP